VGGKQALGGGEIYGGHLARRARLAQSRGKANPKAPRRGTISNTTGGKKSTWGCGGRGQRLRPHERGSRARIDEIKGRYKRGRHWGKQNKQHRVNIEREKN